ncbi:MAG TPA: cytochrome c [Bryobacteraceae bacterium]|nr:cytochrome c [Bryobacteraceae bacterium]
MTTGAKLAALVFSIAWGGWAADDGKTVLDGVYSTEQATRGQAAYTASCSSCHLDDLTAYRGALHGKAFVETFQGDTLESLFRLTKTTMPRDAPASLGDETYLDIVAYVLQVNGFPAGGQNLKSDSLKNIKIVGKTGSEPVPNFALVSVIGCLIEAPGDHWTLTQATEPSKSSNPDAVSPVELKAFQAAPPGKQKFTLLDAGYFKPASHKNHKMAVKGFLIRHAEGDEINVTSLHMLASSCAMEPIR